MLSLVCHGCWFMLRWMQSDTSMSSTEQGMTDLRIDDSSSASRYTGPVGVNVGHIGSFSEEHSGAEGMPCEGSFRCKDMSSGHGMKVPALEAQPSQCDPVMSQAGTCDIT